MAKHSRVKIRKTAVFALLLVATAIVIIPIVLLVNHLTNQRPEEPPAITTVATKVTTTTTETPTTTTTAAPTTTVAPTTADGTTTKASDGEKEPAPGSVSFPDTLFIGDSRTVGLSLYGKITDATFFCKTSVSSNNILNISTDVSGMGTVTLSQVLAKKQFKTVYIMLGINEVGGNHDSIAKKYQQIIDLVKSKQPGAKIIVQSTIHVAASYSTKMPAFRSSNVDHLNEKLKALADNSMVFYIDVNPLFDDANGNLDSKYTSDGCHFYAKYYPLWRDYLAEHR